MENHVITLQRDDSNVVKVHLYGATVVSWMSDSKERLYLSPLSELQGSKAIRGGIPLVFRKLLLSNDWSFFYRCSTAKGCGAIEGHIIRLQVV